MAAACGRSLHIVQCTGPEVNASLLMKPLKIPGSIIPLRVSIDSGHCSHPPLSSHLVKATRVMAAVARRTIMTPRSRLLKGFVKEALKFPDGGRVGHQGLDFAGIIRIFSKRILVLR